MQTFKVEVMAITCAYMQIVVRNHSNIAPGAPIDYLDYRYGHYAAGLPYLERGQLLHSSSEGMHVSKGCTSLYYNAVQLYSTQ